LKKKEGRKAYRQKDEKKEKSSIKSVKLIIQEEFRQEIFLLKLIEIVTCEMLTSS
jgi:hypothetical protein